MNQEASQIDEESPGSTGPIDQLWAAFLQVPRPASLSPSDLENMRITFYVASLNVYNLMVLSLRKSPQVSAQVTEAIRINLELALNDGKTGTILTTNPQH